MKVSISDNNFRPFSIHFEIETEEEARLFFHVFHKIELRKILTSDWHDKEFDKSLIKEDFDYRIRNSVCSTIANRVGNPTGELIL